MFFYIVLTPISTTSGLWSTGNTRKYHQIDVYIDQCGDGVFFCIYIFAHIDISLARGQFYLFKISLPRKQAAQ